MRKIVKIMAVTLMVISFVMPGHAADVTSQFDTYFTANAIAGVEGFHQEMKDKHILLVGEHHGIADNYNLYLALLHTFTQGHVQLVLELPPSSAYLLGNMCAAGIPPCCSKAFHYCRAPLVTRRNISISGNRSGRCILMGEPLRLSEWTKSFN